MTKQEAILALKELKDWKGLPFCIEEPMENDGVGVITEEAFDMAIEALEQIDKIKEIIAIDNMVIQEDVLKYKADGSLQVYKGDE